MQCFPWSFLGLTTSAHHIHCPTTLQMDYHPTLGPSSSLAHKQVLVATQNHTQRGKVHVAWNPLEHDSKPHTPTGMNVHTITHTLTPTSILYPNLLGERLHRREGLHISCPGQEGVRDGATGQRRILTRKSANLPIVTEFSFRGWVSSGQSAAPVAQPEGELSLGPDIFGGRA